MSRPMLLIGTSLLAATPLSATETVTFSYDGRGRLVSALRSGTVNNNVVADYTYDDADNRTSVTVAGATTPTPTPTPAPSFAIANAAAAAEGGTLSFTVTKTGSTASAFDVAFASGDGTASAGSDYTASSGMLSFAAAETSKVVTIATIDDGAVEADETVLVTLSGPSGGATITAGQASGTIVNNDAPPAAPVFDVSNAAAVMEGAPLTFTVTKTGSTSATFSVAYATADGSAAAGSDYQATSGTLSFGPAETSKTVSVTTTDDSIVESAETLLLNLSSPSGGATISTAQGSGTINSNDTPNTPPVAVADTMSMPRCSTFTKNLIANDSDADGDLPLTITGFSGPATQALSIEQLNAGEIEVTAGNVSGSYWLDYTVRDSRNATATARLTVTVSGVAPCNP